MKVGFTGTRQGMSANQKKQLRKVLSAVTNIDEFHHGAAIGADTEAVDIAEDYVDGGPTRIISWPAAKGKELARDRTIVAESDILIAAPLTDKEVLRSGTWATIRYAFKKGIPIVMLPRK